MSHGGNSDDIVNIQGAVQSLRSKGAKLWIENGRLCYRVPKGRVIADDITALSRADRSLLALLFQQAAERPWEPRLLRRPDPMRAPLAFSQIGHWNLRAAAYHKPIRQVASATRLEGSLDAGALRDALSVMVGRHEALRTRIVVRDAESVQEIAEPGGGDLEVIDLSRIPHCNHAREIQKQITSAIVDVADYAADPLWVAVLLNVGPNENILILAMDHIVSDGASLSILFNELLTTCARLTNGTPVSLPPIRMQLADYATWQKAELTDCLQSRIPECVTWPRIRFPEDAAVTEIAGMQGWGVVRFTIESRAKRALQYWARRRGTSLVMTVLTAYVALVLRWCGVIETIVQFVSDGRLSPLLDNTVGYITFPLYLRIGCGRGTTFVDLLEGVTREYCRASERPDFGYAYAQNPLPDLVRNTAFNWLPVRAESSGPLSGGSAAILNTSGVSFEHPALEAFGWDGEPWVIFYETESAVIGEVGFPRQRFSYSSMRRFTGNFHEFLDALLADPGMRIQDVAWHDW